MYVYVAIMNVHFPDGCKTSILGTYVDEDMAWRRALRDEYEKMVPHVEQEALLYESDRVTLLEGLKVYKAMYNKLMNAKVDDEYKRLWADAHGAVTEYLQSGWVYEATVVAEKLRYDHK
jgi:hypothetical protein